jgi:hypothetical protein
MLPALAAVGRFWYRFIVGDDWTIAAAVALALVATFALGRLGPAVWWLTPLVVIAILGISLRRARRA